MFTREIIEQQSLIEFYKNNGMLEEYYKREIENAWNYKTLDKIYSKEIWQGEHRINHCQAWFIEYGNFKIVKSYNTIVAVYCKDIDVLFSIGRFSNTTYQHIRKFRNNYLPNTYRTKEINLELVNWYR